jgi:hypothetical protein
LATAQISFNLHLQFWLGTLATLILVFIAVLTHSCLIICTIIFFGSFPNIFSLLLLHFFSFLSDLGLTRLVGSFALCSLRV